MPLDFSASLAVVGAVVLVLSALSAYIHDKPFSIATLAVLIGLAIGYGGIVIVRSASPLARWVVELTLLFTLFSDGLIVEQELFRRHWRAPLRALALTMPLTLAATGLLARAVFPQLSWPEAFLLGAVLSPTDPVVSASVVTSQDVPPRLRHVLNLESGLNDAIASPYVLLFAFLSAHGHSAASAVTKGFALTGESIYGAVLGFVAGWGAGWLMRHLRRGGLTESRAIVAVALGLAAYGLAELTDGNGLLTVFVAAITLAVSSKELPEHFGELTEGTSSILQIVVYLIIGTLAATVGLGVPWWRLVIFIAGVLVVARPAAIGLSFLGLDMPAREKAFVAWFGPKAVASLLYALVVLATPTPHRTLILQVTVMAVLASILVHSTTEQAGTRWLSRNAQADRT